MKLINLKMRSDIKKAVIAPDSFKGTLTSIEVCEIIKNALEEKYPDIQCITLPVADGGEGTVDAFLYALEGERVSVKVSGPIGRNIIADYAVFGDMAVIETAAASGLPLLKEKAPLDATTFGTGELILDALSRGVRKIVIGLGGSATTDGGTGCLTALGVRFLTKNGCEVISGEKLCEIIDIDLSNLDVRLNECEIMALCDVTNPLCGKNGAACTFSQQKGANLQQVEFLDNGLKNLAKVSKEKLGIDMSENFGAGAAGGLGFALMSFLSAKFESGAEAVLRILNFEEKINGADIIITGEGKMDTQSLHGKVPFTVARKSHGVPVVAIVGVRDIDEKIAKEAGISRIIETNTEKLPFDEVKKHCREQLKVAAEMI